ncbi:MAG: sulfatase-like hydrolase/transferase, partial [Elusimicrobia bacterium]|nr:sulfatase-like hydrolase/transferase [Elusimicrobiota bacterium]
MKILKNFFCLAFVYLLFFSIARLVFFLVFKNGPVGLTETAQAFLIGARIDLSLISQFALLPYFLLSTAGIIVNARKPAVLYFSALNVVFVFLLVAEFPFYAQYGSKLNHLFFEYLANIKEVALIVSGTVSLPSALVAAAGLCFAAATLTAKFIKSALNHEGGKLAHKILSLALILVLSIIFIRGGLQRRPLNWGSAFFSKSNFLNQTALNGIYNLFAQYRIYLEERRGNIVRANYFPPDTAKKIALEFSDYNRRGESILTLPKNFKPNVVVVFMESFAMSENLSPNFNELSGRGILFTNFYASATRTSRSLAATLCSFPPLPGVNMTKKTQSQQKIPSVADVLGRYGYQTMFFYGGDRNFEGLGAFLLNSGFDKFYDYRDYKNIKYSYPVGVYDEELFENAAN